jgi:spore coat protein U-like protein
MAFGSISPTGTASSTSTVTVNCANGTAYSISATGNSAACSNGTLIGNTMFSSTNTSGSSPYYQLFKDSAHSAPLLAYCPGGGPSGTALTGTGTGAAQTQTIYGLLNGSTGSSPSSAGNYTDTATVTVTF